MIANHKISGRLLLAALVALGFSGAAIARTKAESVRAPAIGAKSAKANPAAARHDAGTAGKADTSGASEAQPASADTAAEQAAMQGASPDLKDRLVLSHDKFTLLDANKDGFIEREEATVSNILQARFDKYDTNHDGKLSVLEFAAINDLAAIKPPPAPDSDQSMQ